MIQIKFRAWNKTHKWMDNEFTIHADGCIYQDARRRWDISDIAVETAYDDLEIMQFTGLLDKNGKEIYEGDIVKCIDHPTNIESGVFEIAFNTGAFVCKGSMVLLRDFGTAWTEVIGNIYSNPELL